MLDDWKHWSIIVLDGIPSIFLTNYRCFLRDVTVCSGHNFKNKQDFYLFTVPDYPCRTGFNNSLDHGDCLG